MTTIRATRTTKLMLVGLACAAALAVAPAASASPAASLRTTNTCWLAVINDWLRHGQVTGTYAIPCYTQAIQHLSAYPDISQYSSAIEDIHRALLFAVNHRGSGPPSTGGGGTGGGGGGPSAAGGGGGGGPSAGGGGGAPVANHHGLIARVAQKLGPGNAQSIPLPLLVLGGLALLLLLAAAATWLARRLQARRVTPAPAHASAGTSVRPKT